MSRIDDPPFSSCAAAECQARLMACVPVAAQLSYQRQPMKYEAWVLKHRDRYLVVADLYKRLQLIWPHLIVKLLVVSISVDVSSTTAFQSSETSISHCSLITVSIV